MKGANYTSALQENVRNCAMESNGEPLFITMSFGASVFTGEEASALIQSVDELLYEAKRQGRDQIVWGAKMITT